MSGYTPTTRQVRACYTVGVDNNSAEGREFDRWLNSVKAEAWDECLESLRAELEHELQYVDIRNPYREVSK